MNPRAHPSLRSAKKAHPFGRASSSLFGDEPTESGISQALPVLKRGGRLVLIVWPEHKPRPLVRQEGILRWAFVAPLELLLSEHDKKCL
ncbi:MAG: hypothetical protein RQ868_10215 [Meiothermus sp.]|uniref:hypothetical protein n=1 Tax=Meiothermus sp. TaxID=1955249 RepID=UPI0028CF047D|nr:hypothetical protein [Meiothermus sp.]MDT7920949.1 hypothetical protein [Meiothermus sp.]